MRAFLTQVSSSFSPGKNDLFLRGRFSFSQVFGGNVSAFQVGGNSSTACALLEEHARVGASFFACRVWWSSCSLFLLRGGLLRKVSLRKAKDRQGLCSFRDEGTTPLLLLSTEVGGFEVPF